MTPVAVASVPRLLAGLSQGQLGIDEHAELHGEMPALGHRDGPDLIELVAASGLRGRGGAAFPTATKMMAVAQSRRDAIVVANGAEGEPASAKDRTLLESSPHLVIDGAQLAAQAVGAREVVICIRRSSTGACDAVKSALGARAQRRLLPVPTRIVPTPSTYLAGEENALVNTLNGGPPKPTFVPPRAFERGVGKRPTLVQNIETLAHIGLIARHGAAWFRQAGTAEEPGTTLVTLLGAVARPGVYEIELGTTLHDVLTAAGGLTHSLRALLLGGYYGSWLDGALARELVLHEEHLRPLGGGLGSGVIAALPDTACAVMETQRVMSYLTLEAAGQCGPCTNGLGALSEAVAQLARGAPSPTVDDDLARWTTVIPQRGACHLPDGAVRFVTSALDVFAEEFSDHRQHGPCVACAEPSALPIPRRSPRAVP